jgi:hypothetical protein
MTNEKKTRRLFSKTCTECGCEFTTPKADAGFCAPSCRMAWHNRRRDRGAELYDIIMAQRFDRQGAKGGLGEKQMRAIVDRLVMQYNIADKELRGGRLSFDPTAWERIPLAFDSAGDNR